MKIDVYKVPVSLIRTAAGIETKLDEDKRLFVRSENIEGNSGQMIPNIAKELSDYNNQQLTIAKNMLLPREDKTEGHVFFKYLS